MTIKQAYNWLMQPGIQATIYHYDDTTNKALKTCIDVAGKDIEVLTKDGDLISRTHFSERIRQAVGMVEDEMTDDEKSIVEQILAMLDMEIKAVIK